MAPQTRRRKKALPAPRPAPVIDPADRLSNLPDEIQAHILSFLPAQDAVRTCVLARTWCDVWKLTRRLLITGDEGVLVKDVRGFVDGLLRRRLDGLQDRDLGPSTPASPPSRFGPIDACEISFHFECDENDEEGFKIGRAIWRWILHVLECQVKSLRVDISTDCSGTGAIPMRHTTLVSQHLTRLELSGLEFPLFGILNFSHCPVLEHLEITGCDMCNVIEVTSPSVKRLVITGDESYGPRFYVPLVVSLSLDSFYDNTLVLESMPQLAEAYVFIQNNPEEDDSDEDITKCMVLEGLAVAKHLELLSDDDVITFTRDLWFCPTFSNLKTLVLNHFWCQSEDCSDLGCMLQHAPVLEKLTVVFSYKVESEYDMVVEGHPDPTGNSTMISQHVKIVEIKCFEVDQEVVSVLKFLGTLNIRFEDRETEGSK